MEITNIKSFQEYYKSIRQRTNRLITIIPKQYMNWAYKENKFTIADHIRHIAATERYMFAETIQGKPCAYQGCGKELADGYENVLRYFHEKHQESLAIFNGLDNEDLNRKCLK